MAPRRLYFAGGVFAACVATSIPGLAWLMGSCDVADSDLVAIAPEVLVAGLMGAFGATRLRAQMLGRGRWGPRLFLAGCVVMAGLVGLIIDAGVTAGSVDSGPAFVLGFPVVAAWMGLLGAMGIGVARLLTRLTRSVGDDLGSPAPAGEAKASARIATWLLAAAGAHLVLKGATGGPVLGAIVTFAVAVSFARRSGNLADSPLASRLVPLGLIGLALGLGVQSAYRWREARADSYARIPLCMPGDATLRGAPRETDVLGRLARRVDGVADAVADYANVQTPDAYEVTLYVLPVGGGPLSGGARAAVEQAVKGVKCAQDDSGRQPKVTVKEATSVPVEVTAKVRLDPNTDLAAIRARIESDVHAAFDPQPGRDLICVTSRSARPEPATSSTGGIRSVEYMADGLSLYDRIGQLPMGAAPVVRRVEVDVAP